MIEAYLKAPWTTALDDVPYQELGEAWTVNSEEGSICTVDCPRAYAEKVAHLIAAAPLLYETLASIKGVGPLTRNRIDKALARARGETS